MVGKRTKKINGLQGGSGEKSTKTPSKLKQFTKKVKSFFTPSKPVIGFNNPGFKLQTPEIKLNPLYETSGKGKLEPHYEAIKETNFQQPTYAQPNPISKKSNYNSRNFYSLPTTNSPAVYVTPQKPLPLTPDNLKSNTTRKAITALQKAYIENPHLIKKSSGKGTSQYNIGNMQKLLKKNGITDDNLITKLTSDVSQLGLSAVSRQANLGFSKNNYRSARNFNKNKFIQSMPNNKKQEIQNYIDNPQTYANKTKSKQLQKYISNNSVNATSKSRLISELIKIGKDKTNRGEKASLSHRNVGNAIARVNKIRDIRKQYGIKNVSENGIYQEVKNSNKKTNGYMTIVGRNPKEQTYLNISPTRNTYNGYIKVKGANTQNPEYLNIYANLPPPKT